MAGDQAPITGRLCAPTDTEADILSYFDSGAALEDQEASAEECANEILFLAGFPVEV